MARNDLRHGRRDVTAAQSAFNQPAATADDLQEAMRAMLIVRKLGTPGHRELAMGAIASGGIRVINEDVVRWLGISPEQIETVAREEQRELERRHQAYLEGRAPQPLEGRIAIFADDGLEPDHDARRRSDSAEKPGAGDCGRSCRGA